MSLKLVHAPPAAECNYSVVAWGGWCLIGVVGCNFSMVAWGGWSPMDVPGHVTSLIVLMNSGMLPSVGRDSPAYVVRYAFVYAASDASSASCYYIL